MSESQRPSVTISQQTATTIGIEVKTNGGSVWIVVGHEKVLVVPNNLEVEVKP